MFLLQTGRGDLYTVNADGTGRGLLRRLRRAEGRPPRGVGGAEGARRALVSAAGRRPREDGIARRRSGTRCRALRRIGRAPGGADLLRCARRPDPPLTRDACRVSGRNHGLREATVSNGDEARCFRGPMPANVRARSRYSGLACRAELEWVEMHRPLFDWPGRRNLGADACGLSSGSAFSRLRAKDGGNGELAAHTASGILRRLPALARCASTRYACSSRRRRTTITMVRDTLNAYGGRMPSPCFLRRRRGRLGERLGDALPVGVTPPRPRQARGTLPSVCVRVTSTKRGRASRRGRADDRTHHIAEGRPAEPL
jgi:hypothetical protein